MHILDISTVDLLPEALCGLVEGLVALVNLFHRISFVREIQHQLTGVRRVKTQALDVQFQLLTGIKHIFHDPRLIHDWCVCDLQIP